MIWSDVPGCCSGSTLHNITDLTTNHRVLLALLEEMKGAGYKVVVIFTAVPDTDRYDAALEEFEDDEGYDEYYDAPEPPMDQYEQEEFLEELGFVKGATGVNPHHQDYTFVTAWTAPVLDAYDKVKALVKGAEKKAPNKEKP